MTTREKHRPAIVERFDEPLSEGGRQALESLRVAVREALDRKRRLGQYAIVWKDGRVQKVPPEALPFLSDDLEGAAFLEANQHAQIAAHEAAPDGLPAATKVRPKRRPST